MRKCKIDRCEAKHHSRGYCQPHYRYLMKYGDPLGRGVLSTGTTLEKFYSRIEMVPESGCWIWTATANKHGYGQLRVNWKMKQAHRYSYEMHKGEIPEGKLVCHKCDVRSCVNPDHLFLGTHQDNANDMVKKGRSLSCEKNGRAKLDYDEALFVFTCGLPTKFLAEEFGVSRTLIDRIKTQRSWKILC